VPTNTTKNSKLLFLNDFMFTPCEVGLTHLGLSPHPTPKAPARYDPFAEADIYSTYL